MLTADTALTKVSLGRPWGPFAAVAYIHCYIGSHIIPEGWATWNGTDSYKTTRYVEYKNYGPGANVKNRVAWSRQLTDDEKKQYNLHSVFGDWKPGK